MDDSRELLREARESIDRHCAARNFMPDHDGELLAKIDAALSQPAPEPDAWMRNGEEGECETVITNRTKEIWLGAKPWQVKRYTIPLYRAAPPSAEVPALTESKLMQIANSIGLKGEMCGAASCVWTDGCDGVAIDDLLRLVRAAQEKSNG